MFKVIGDLDRAVTEARASSKILDNVKLYETATGKFIITDQPQHENYEEIDYRKVSIQAIKQYGYKTMEEVPLEMRV